MTSNLPLAILTAIFMLMTFLPLVRHDHWTFRVLEYPRLQKLIIGLAITAATVWLRPVEDYWLLLSAQGVCLAYLVYKIFPYTPLAKREMKNVKGKAGAISLKLFTANVFQDNRDYGRMLQQIRSCDPDIVFLLETDPGWKEGMKALEKDYPYRLAEPLPNTYGLLFFSRLPLSGHKVQYLADPEIPSVFANVQLRENIMVRLYGLHPKPPVPQESRFSTAKDKELMKVALDIDGHKDPCIVMGDLNDVAWSYVTELFRKVSGLIDPRRGRGFFSTFSANHWWMRFPLDYVFCSTHFGLHKMTRMTHNGSDHFAMFIHLEYLEQLTQVQEKPEADAVECEAAVEKAKATVPSDSERG